MSHPKLWKAFFNVIAGFANDLEVSNHSILNELVVQKGKFIHVRHVFFYALNGFENVCQVVRKTMLIPHTGRASASTLARKASGSAFGVRTST